MARHQNPGMTSVMIFSGIFLLSALSFFTTFSGLTILLDWPLAAIGALGLQAAMLGIAWNVMRIQGHRTAYITVFTIAAAFSIFFSYANFNTALKSGTRVSKVRSDYLTVAKPVLLEYADLTRKALFQGAYQSERIADLLDLEETKGWATVVDEGSNDKFVQEIINGARRTVASWEANEGGDYRQGAGRGIIANYLTSWQQQVNANVAALSEYLAKIDSTSLAMNTTVSVSDQYAMVNHARVYFPLAQYAAINAGALPNLPVAPLSIGYLESAATGQEAMMLVINDLKDMDGLSWFALLFACAVDFMVLIIALAANRSTKDESSRFFERTRAHYARRMMHVALTDLPAIDALMDESLERLRKANWYEGEVGKLLFEHDLTTRRITLMRGTESIEGSKIGNMPEVSRTASPAPDYNRLTDVLDQSITNR